MSRGLTPGFYPFLFSVQREGLGSDQKSITLLNMSKVFFFFFSVFFFFFLALSTRSLSSRLLFPFPPVAVVVTLSPGRRSIFNDPAVALWKWASAGEAAAGPKSSWLQRNLGRRRAHAGDNAAASWGPRYTFQWFAVREDSRRRLTDAETKRTIPIGGWPAVSCVGLAV